MGTTDQDREGKADPRIQDDRGCGLVKGVFNKAAGQARQARQDWEEFLGLRRSHAWEAAIVAKGLGLPQMLRRAAEGWRPL